eukprot:GILJ01000758.1.p1 GENE.GILJ01000758.1~~GILJ01000758.1.p1  ORF type:complete len:1153 (-),score=201.35 GILJ01000758.1:459-3812(-)
MEEAAPRKTSGHQPTMLPDTLINIVKAYLQRTSHEEVEMLELCGQMHGVALSLATDLETGLDVHAETEDGQPFAKRQLMYGANRRAVPPPKGFWELCWDAWGDFTLRILTFSALISLAIGLAMEEDKSHSWIEGFAILMAVVIVVCVTATNDMQKEKQFRALNAVRNNRDVFVMRNGEKTSVSVFDLQVGDVLLIESGDDIPADALLISGFSVRSDESTMTGETDLIDKASVSDCLAKIRDLRGETGVGAAQGKGHHAVPSPVLVSGTKVMEGTGRALIVAVGKNSEVGRAMSLMQQDAEATPLQMKLERIARDVGKMGLFAAVITVCVLYLRFLIECFAMEKYAFDNDSSPSELVRYFIVGVTIVVVAIPEGLPLAVTISLAYSVKKMLNDKNLVRRLQACETMGGANQICSDKTGTLTTNRMTVKRFYNGSELLFDKQNPQPTDFSPESATMIAEAIAINSTAFLTVIPTKEGLFVNHNGSKTECALLQLCQDIGKDYEKIRQSNEAHISKRYPFSSARKKMSTVLSNVPYNGNYRTYVKGASEIVLKNCKFYLNEKGVRMDMTDTQRAQIYGVIDEFAKSALRTICIAYRDADANFDWDAKDDDGQPLAETELTMLGIAGIQDPVRREVPGAVRACQKAGITVRMVTGDNLTTAKAIGKDCGIYHPETGGLAMEGPEFVRMVGGLVCKSCRTTVCECARDTTSAKKMKKPLRVDTIANGEEFDKVWPYLEVLARSRPEDKYCLVTGLMERGQVVAVTGDGTNDGPALKKANVGFAMGITGTEVAKEASDIILLDDNFTSIVKAVMWGRNVYDNIRKFLQFQLTVNVVAVVTAFFGALLMKESPLTAVQMLWVNLIMDTFASLALATEPPSEELLNRHPHRRDEYIISKKMLRNILGQAFYQLIVMFSLAFAGEYFLPEFGSGTSICYSPGTEYVCPGRRYDFNGFPLYPVNSSIGPSRHLTYVFNTFVLLQLFNEINSRKLNNELNVFKDFQNNPMFWVIWVLTMGIQIIMVQFGGIAMSCHFEGLTWQQWLICVALGSGSLLVGVIVHLLPDSCCPTFGQKEEDPMSPSRGALVVRRATSSRVSKVTPIVEDLTSTTGKSVRVQPLGISSGEY